MYKRLAQSLVNSRKTLTKACQELDVDIEYVDDALLQAEIDQCSHCNIWSKQLQDDQDGNPVCPVCVRLVGL